MVHPLLVLLAYPPRSPLVLDRVRSIYPALSSALAASWLPLVVGLTLVVIVFRLQAQA